MRRQITFPCGVAPRTLDGIDLDALEAERERPVVPPPSVGDLIQRLIATLHDLWKTPPDGATSVDNQEEGRVR